MSLQAASHGRVLPGLPVDSLQARVHSGAALGGTGPHTVISLSGRRRPWAVTRFHRAQIHSCIFGLASALLLSVLDAIATCFLSDSVKGWFRESSSIVYGNMPFDIIDFLYEISDIYACRGSTGSCAHRTHFITTSTVMTSLILGRASLYISTNCSVDYGCMRLWARFHKGAAPHSGYLLTLLALLWLSI